ncbi:MAG TPA: vgr related protein [Sphingomicrobium sp.]|nr:vgr related protein [Sphingomicrobium sp.]
MDGKRPLTAGEIELARSVFGDAIDYGRVKLVRRKWWPFQPKGIVMAPTGNIHFHPDSPIWSDDFSKERLSLQGLFIHEMAHVWQAQTRGRFYLPLMRHPFCRYSYRLIDGRPFDRYGLEQQAEIARHSFLAARGAANLTSLPRGFLPFNASVTETQQS